MNRALKFGLLCAVTAVSIVFVAVFALASVILAAIGILSVFVSLGIITGLLNNVATDLYPVAMLLTGLFCVFSALALFFVLLILCPKAVRRFNMIMENVFS